MADSRPKSFISRALETPWREASEEFPVLLLTGPRQVGKTTLLEHLCEPGRRTVTLDDPALRELARRDPALFLQRFAPPVLIDEIQYAPGLLPYIKMQVDHERRPGRFWLTGSQQFHLMKGVTESLAGRVAIVNLLGFSARETDSRACDLPPFLPLPERLSERETSATASDLAATYRRIWLGSLPALASGQVLLLAPNHTSATTRLIKRPKPNFLDTGLASYLTEWSSPETLASGAMAGAMLETFVVAEVLKSWWHRAERPSLYQYRDKDGRETTSSSPAKGRCIRSRSSAPRHPIARGSATSNASRSFRCAWGRAAWPAWCRGASLSTIETTPSRSD